MRKLIAAIVMAVTLSLFAGTATAHAATAESKAYSVAVKQLGKKYAMGGKGPSSFDCSGLVVYAFKTTKKNPPRTAQAQFKASKSISKKNAKKGDLVFFTNKNSSKPFHVGIVSKNGGNQMIHANSGTYYGKKVIRESIASGTFWTKNYKVTYRRIK